MSSRQFHIPIICPVFTWCFFKTLCSKALETGLQGGKVKCTAPQLFTFWEHDEQKSRVWKMPSESSLHPTVQRKFTGIWNIIDYTKLTFTLFKNTRFSSVSILSSCPGNLGWASTLPRSAMVAQTCKSQVLGRLRWEDPLSPGACLQCATIMLVISAAP